MARSGFASDGEVLSGERRVLELIASGAGLEETLDALCRSIDEASGLISIVMLLDREGDRLKLAAGPRLNPEWRATIASFPVTLETGTCGTAVIRREQVIEPDIPGSPLFSQWRALARAAHFDAAWSTPFFSKDGRVLGTFAVFSPAKGLPSAEHLNLVARATRLASIAVERHTTERDLRESELRFRQIADHIHEVFWLSTADLGAMLYVSRGYETVWGASRESLYREPSSWLSAIHPDDRPRVKAVIEKERERGFEVEYRIVRPDGETRAIWDRGFPIRDRSNQLYRVAGIAEDVTGRRQAEEALRRSEQLLRLVLEAIPVGVAFLGLNGDIMLNNTASDRIWANAIRPGAERYARTRGWWHESGKPVEGDDWASVRALRQGETSLNEVIDIEAFDGTRRVIQNSAVPIRDEHDAIVGAVVVNEDITARKKAERDLEATATQMQALATRLLQAQDEERRRIAQMLHETTAQDLAALKMLLARVQRTSPQLSEAEKDLLAEMVVITDRSMEDVRTLSYLLHPPFLDEGGLLSALRWYVEGFARRSGIKVELDVPPDFPRLPRDVETTLFRIVQEALVNVYRHAESPTARIRLAVDPGDHNVTLEIQDSGRGMPSRIAARLSAGEGALGVGIVGMRERVKQLGGTLDIESGDRGTLVRAVFPTLAGAA
ncbi:MAG TPA: PAS domain S-box protein [Vicinamibacterales bacterium]|nr:PAS domain S-box protein [Vicinamibacterales bacterium]